MNHSQVSPGKVFWVILACCCGLVGGAERAFGWQAAFLVAFWLAPPCALAGLFVAHHYAPALTRNATVLTFFLACGVSLLLCYTVRAREQSRRLSCGRNLIELGRSLHDRQNLDTQDSNQAPAPHERWIEYYMPNIAASAELPSEPAN